MNTEPTTGTPETDDEEEFRGGDEYYHDFIKADFARKLERERDEARKMAEYWQGQFCHLSPESEWHEFPWGK